MLLLLASCESTEFTTADGDSAPSEQASGGDGELEITEHETEDTAEASEQEGESSTEDGDAPEADAIVEEDGDTSDEEADAFVEDGDIDPPEEQEQSPPLFQSSGNPYEPGALDITTSEITEAPVAFMLIHPTIADAYPIIVFQHGFLMANDYYSQMLEHIASHGFVIVAPQMYAADMNPMGKPSAYEEAESALALYEWLPENLPGIVYPEMRVDILGLSGHSRGGKVLWAVLKERPMIAEAAAGVDPVDGTGGPLGGEERVIDGAFGYRFPTLVIGTGYGPEALNAFSPACAPTGDNHEQFYAAAQPPAFHSIATNYGHNDMLNDDLSACGFVCTACKEGQTRPPMRAFTAGQLTAFFRHSLQQDETAIHYLLESRFYPIEASFEMK